MFSSILFTLALLVVGCAPVLKNCKPDTSPPAPVDAKDREMLTLALVSYAGEQLKGSDDRVAVELAPCIVWELEEQPLTAGKWDLVWGPMVFKFELATYDDNMMYVVRSRQDPEHLVVGVRGTNSIAVLDWALEDFDVFGRLVKWPYGNPAPLKPKISRATHTGLTALRDMVPPEGVPGAGLSLQKFLTQEAQGGRLHTLEVTGHSLGGALAPTLTLWLADTQATWDPDGKVEVGVWAYAGPTAGNDDFAAYSEKRIGARTHRVFNRHDMVPKAWNVCLMEEVKSLYKPQVRTPEVVKVATDLAIDGVRHKRYTQLPEGRSVDTPVFPQEGKFWAQVGWQHVCGYVCALGIEDKVKAATPDCSKSSQPLRCPQCPPKEPR